MPPRRRARRKRAPFGAANSAGCGRKPRRARRCCRPRTRSCSRWRMRARPNGIARTSPGSSSSFCSSRTTPAIAISTSAFGFLFNSYYVAAGPRHARPQRGLITRPNGEDVAAYRAHVDAAVERLIENVPAARRRATSFADPRDRAASRAAASGIDAHRHPARLRAEPDRSGLRSRTGSRPSRPRAGAVMPMCRPASSRSATTARASASTTRQPRIDVLMPPVRIARHLVTNAEWLEFMADGGYATPSLWLSDGWAAVAGRRLAGARLLAQAATAPGIR